MKLNIKLKNFQMLLLLEMLKNFEYKENHEPTQKKIDNLVLINLNSFYNTNIKYFISPTVVKNKSKVFKVDVNHYASLYNFILQNSTEIDGYFVHLIIYIEQQIQPQIENYKTTILNHNYDKYYFAG